MIHGMGFTSGLGQIALLRQLGEGLEQGRCSSGILPLGSYLLLEVGTYCSAPLGLCRWAFPGLIAPVMGQGVAQQGIICAPPPALVSLGSFVGLQMSFVT